MTHAETSLFKQPRAVWAVAFACVIAFMGIGLVDPILPAIAKDLDASPSQVELLFTSYFAVTGVAMLVTGFVSSRIGPKRTLLAGLALVVTFAAVAGSSSTIGEIVGFRAGWGLGNALFIATALSVIVGASSGGVAGAIILYEAALGVGLASGPLLGGLLGGISWRGPFFGTAVLMAIGFALIVALLEKSPTPPRKMSITEPLKALGHRGLLITALVALFYNYGFFTLLAYTPLPLGLGAHEMGLVFFGWGLLLALTSVFAAPRLHHRFGIVPTLAGALTFVALDLVALGLGVDSKTVLIVGIIVAGAFLGIVNTVLTETVMKVSPVDRPIASASYSFVRFTGGAIAPFLAGKLAEHVSTDAPFYVGATGVALSIVVLVAGRSALRAAEEPAETELEVAVPAATPATVLAAVDATTAAAAVTDAAASLARARGSAVELVHVRETALAGDDATDLESVGEADYALRERLDQLKRAGVAAGGVVLHSIGDHAGAAEAILARARETGADVVVLGTPATHDTPLGHDLARAAEGAHVDVVMIDPDGERTLAA